MVAGGGGMVGQTTAAIDDSILNTVVLGIPFVLGVTYEIPFFPEVPSSRSMFFSRSTLFSEYLFYTGFGW